MLYVNFNWYDALLAVNLRNTYIFIYICILYSSVTHTCDCVATGTASKNQLVSSGVDAASDILS